MNDLKERRQRAIADLIRAARRPARKSLPSGCRSSALPSPRRRSRAISSRSARSRSAATASSSYALPDQVQGAAEPAPRRSASRLRALDRHRGQPRRDQDAAGFGASDRRCARPVRVCPRSSARSAATTRSSSPAAPWKQHRSLPRNYDRKIESCNRSGANRFDLDPRLEQALTSAFHRLQA